MTGYVLDTNFIVRYLVADNEELYKQTSLIFLEIKNNNMKASLTGEVLAETIFVLDSVYQVPKDIIFNKLIQLIICYKDIEIKKYLLDALLLFKKENLHIVDCMIIEKSKASNSIPLSSDEKLLKLFTTY